MSEHAQGIDTMRHQPMEKSAMRTDGEVLVAVDRIGSQIEDLEGIVARLIDRLGPVLRPNVRDLEDRRAIADREASGIAVADLADRHADRLSSATRELIALNDRIAL